MTDKTLREALYALSIVQGHYSRETVGYDACETIRSALSAPVEPVALTDEQIDRIAENCAKAMPDGISGFCKTWGWRQFARELLDVCAGHYRAAPPVATQAGAAGEPVASEGYDSLFWQDGQCGSANIVTFDRLLATPTQPEATKTDGAVSPDQQAAIDAADWPYNFTAETKVVALDRVLLLLDAMAAADALAAAPERRDVSPDVGERERFEKWAAKEGYSTKCVSNAIGPDGDVVYDDPRTHAAWWAWQARASLPLPDGTTETLRANLLKCADQIEANRILSGSPGPLYNMGWSSANEVAAEMVRAAVGVSSEGTEAQASDEVARDSLLNLLEDLRLELLREHKGTNSAIVGKAIDWIQGEREDEPIDPMDWLLPCDVTVGHGTIGKGCRLGTLVARMKVLYEMATGNNADAVENRTPEERQALLEKFHAVVAGVSTERRDVSPQADTSAVRIYPPEFPVMPADMAGWKPEDLWQQACLTGWRCADNARPPAVEAEPAEEVVEKHWPILRTLLNDYAMSVHDAASHQSASRADIAHASALSAMQKLRRYIEAMMKSAAPLYAFMIAAAPSQGEGAPNA